MYAEYNPNTHMPQKMSGNSGYHGRLSLKGRVMVGSWKRRTKNDKPVSRKKIQKTGAEPAKRVLKPPKYRPQGMGSTPTAFRALSMPLRPVSVPTRKIINRVMAA